MRDFMNRGRRRPRGLLPNMLASDKNKVEVVSIKRRGGEGSTRTTWDVEFFHNGWPRISVMFGIDELDVMKKFLEAQQNAVRLNPWNYGDQ